MPQQFASLLPLILLFALMYFMMIRPQQQQQKKRQAMLDALRKGDKVVTIGGIHGTITEIRENVLGLKIADKVEIKINRTAVGAVVKQADEKPEKSEKAEEENKETGS